MTAAARKAVQEAGSAGQRGGPVSPHAKNRGGPVSPHAEYHIPVSPVSTPQIPVYQYSHAVGQPKAARKSPKDEK